MSDSRDNEVRFTAAYAPWLLVRFPPTWTAESLDAYFDENSRYFDLNQPYVFITDLSATTLGNTASMRRKATDYMQREAPRFHRLCRAAVQIVGDPLMRGAITALNWVAPRPFPQTTVSTLADGIAWLRPHAAAAGLAPPPEGLLALAAARALGVNGSGWVR